MRQVTSYDPRVGLRVVRHPDAREFLAATAQFRQIEPVGTNMIGSVALSVVAGRPYEGEIWLSVHADPGGAGSPGGPVVGVGMRTPPHNLVVSPMPDPAAVALGEFLAQVDPALPGVTGPGAAVRCVVLGYGASTRARVALHAITRVLGTLHPPAHSVPGAPRSLTSADVPTVARWLVEFAEEAGLHIRPTYAEALADLEWQGLGNLRLWDVAGTPVALGGHAPLVHAPGATVARIGPIFTPSALRRQGFGTSITHALAAHLQPRCDIVMLYCDAANPTSNSIYTRLGFLPAGDLLELHLPE